MRIRWPKSSDFGQNLATRPVGFSNRKPKSDDFGHRILKSKNVIGLSSSQKMTEQSLVYSCSSSTRFIHTNVRETIDALDYEDNHDARTQSPRLSAARLLSLAVGGRRRGSSGQEEQRTQRASFEATSHTRHTQQQQHQHQYVGYRGESDAWVKKIPSEAALHVSSRPD